MIFLSQPWAILVTMATIRIFPALWPVSHFGCIFEFMEKILVVILRWLDTNARASNHRHIFPSRSAKFSSCCIATGNAAAVAPGVTPDSQAENRSQHCISARKRQAHSTISDVFLHSFIPLFKNLVLVDIPFSVLYLLGRFTYGSLPRTPRRE